MKQSTARGCGRSKRDRLVSAIQAKLETNGGGRVGGGGEEGGGEEEKDVGEVRCTVESAARADRVAHLRTFQRTTQKMRVNTEETGVELVVVTFLRLEK